jgi:hypothetical protein
MKSPIAQISILTIGLVLCTSSLALEEYTISSVDDSTGSKILIDYVDTQKNTQKQSLIGDLNGINIIPSIARIDNNQLIAVWQHFNAGKFYLHYSVGSQDKWSIPVRVETGMPVNVSPFIANISSQVILFWSATVNDHDYIFSALYNNNGWSAPRKVPGQNLPINIWPRVISEHGNHFIEWLASNPVEQPYSIQRQQLDVSSLHSLFSNSSRLSKQQDANLGENAFSKRYIQRRPNLRNSINTSRHSKFRLQIQNGQSQRQMRKELQY